MSRHLVRRLTRLAGALTFVLAVSAPAGTAAANPGRPPEPRSSTDFCVPLPFIADPVTPSSVEQFEELVIGTWILCAGDPMWEFYPPAEIGLQFDADGRFFRIHEAADGTLLRAEGLLEEGDWRVILDEFSQQLNVHLLGSGTKMQHPNFFQSPPAFSLGMSGWYYQRWTGPEPVPGLPAGLDRGACGQPTDPVGATSADEVRELLTGTWTLCDGVLAGDQMAVDGEVGLEITEDGRFHRLVRNPDGTVGRGSQPVAHGTVTEIYRSTDHGAPDVPGGFRVHFRTSDDWTIATNPIFFSSPSSMHLGGYPTGTGYHRGEPPALDQRPSPAVPPEGLPATGDDLHVPTAIAAALTTAGGVGLVLIARGARGRQAERR